LLAVELPAGIKCRLYLLLHSNGQQRFSSSSKETDLGKIPCGIYGQRLWKAVKNNLIGFAILINTKKTLGLQEVYQKKWMPGNLPIFHKKSLLFR
jgi:hypothetical protein